MSNQPRFEVFPERDQVSIATYADAPGEGRVVDGATTGQFVWHFRDANGKLTHTGGQGFATRYDAHRSIHGVVSDHAAILLGMVTVTLGVPRDRLPIVDLDADGKVIGVTS